MTSMRAQLALVRRCIDTGNIEAARQALTAAWGAGPEGVDRVKLHALANEVQRAICDTYLNAEGL